MKIEKNITFLRILLMATVVINAPKTLNSGCWYDSHQHDDMAHAREWTIWDAMVLGIERKHLQLTDESLWAG